MRTTKTLIFKTIAVLGLLAAAAGLPAGSAHAGNIIDDWANVKAPPPPELKPATVDARTTALLVLDMVKQTCNAERRPRCLSTVPAVKKVLTEARAKGVMVIYTAIPNVPKTDILAEVAPTGSEPFVQAYLDKYLGTDLEKILKDKGIETVIAVGTAAHGAVITTASESASRGIKVIVPVDALSAENPYAEQYTVWHLTNAPVIPAKITLTKIDMIKF